MAYLNKAQLIGNIGKDPEIRVNQITGRKVVTFSLATSRRYRDNNGEQKESTDWHNIVGYGKVADVFEQLQIRKGTTLYVEGAIQNRSWINQATQQKQYTTEVIIENFQLLTPRNNANGTQGNAYGAPSQSRIAQQVNSAGYAEDDCDLPFDGGRT